MWKWHGLREGASRECQKERVGENNTILFQFKAYFKMKKSQIVNKITGQWPEQHFIKEEKITYEYFFKVLSILNY